MKFLNVLVLLIFPVALQANVLEKTFKHISVMEFASIEEANYATDPVWASNQFNLPVFNLIQKAYAYKEGEACLILGFQSSFKGGMCRLSLAPEAKSLRQSCVRGELPCNPVVFGEKTNGKPFCVPSSIGPELSKYCSYQAFRSIADEKDLKDLSEESRKTLASIKARGPKNFDFDKAKTLSDDLAFSKKFLGHYKDESSLEDAQNFTKTLCHSLKSSTGTRSQKTDLANCNAILSTFEVKKQTTEKVVKDKEVKEPEEKKVQPPQKKIAKKPEPKKKEAVFVDLSERQCKIPDATEIVAEDKVQDIKNVTDALEAQAWMKCANELFYHKDLVPDFRGPYWHTIDNEKFFAKQCWNLDNFGEKEMIYTFMSDSGFKMVKFPIHNYYEKGQEATLPRNVLKFKNGNKNHYISIMGHIGEYFDSFPEKGFDSFINENDLYGKPATVRNRYIKPYENFLSKKYNYSTPELKAVNADASALNDAKSCIKKRLLDYTQFIIRERDPEAIPYAHQMNADVNGINRREPATLAKYKKSVDEIRQKHVRDMLPEGSACLDIISPKDVEAAFDKNFSSRYKQYENYRKVSNP